MQYDAMSRKSKGINAERELVHSFWSRGFACVRVAGSGSSSYPSADLIVGNKNKKYVIECKTTKKDKQYFSKEDIALFQEFAEKFGAVPLVAVKFLRKGWFFIKIEYLEDSGKNLYISDENALKIGLSIEELTAVCKN